MNVIFPKDKATSFLGRNGYFNAIGVEIMAYSWCVALTPVTSKGALARCVVELPRDAETLRQVARQLQEIAETI